VTYALSKVMTFSALFSNRFEQIKDWECKVNHDPKFQGIIHDLIQGPHSHSCHKFQNHKIFFINIG